MRLPKDNRYLLSLSYQEERIGLASVDFSTGEFRVTEVVKPEQALEEIGRINPRKSLFPVLQSETLPLKRFLEKIALYFLTFGEEATFELNRARDLADETFPGSFPGRFWGSRD